MLPIPAGSPPPYVPIAPLYPHLFVTPPLPPLAWQVPLPPLVPPPSPVLLKDGRRGRQFIIRMGRMCVYVGGKGMGSGCLVLPVPLCT